MAKVLGAILSLLSAGLVFVPATAAAQDAATPDAADLPPGQVLYEGTSGGELGCIACDGQSRFISIERSTTALGDAQRAAQEVVWAEAGTVVDFGIRIGKANRGRYGINLFVNGAYSTGCAIETGSSGCRLAAGVEPGQLKVGDRVTIIVGEQGTVDEDGVPVEEGDFVLDWWFVFEPASASTATPGSYATVASFTGEVTYRVGNDGPFRLLTPTTKLPKGAELHTDVDASVRLKFADGTIMELNEMTEVLIANLLVKESRQAVAVQLKLGELSATVNPKKAFQTDFEIKLKSGSTSVRGTVFSVFYDPDGEVTVVSTEEGEVEFDPTDDSLATTTVGAGEELVLRGTTMSDLQAAGTFQVPDVKKESDGGSSGPLVAAAAVVVLGVVVGVLVLKRRRGTAPAESP